MLTCRNCREGYGYAVGTRPDSAEARSRDVGRNRLTRVCEIGANATAEIDAKANVAFVVLVEELNRPRARGNAPKRDGRPPMAVRRHDERSTERTCLARHGTQHL